MERLTNTNEKELQPVIIDYGDEIEVVKVADIEGSKIKKETFSRYKVLAQDEMENKGFSFNIDPNSTRDISENSSLGKALLGKEVNDIVPYFGNNRLLKNESIAYFVRVLSVVK